jgi:hypothetical protein
VVVVAFFMVLLAFFMVVVARPSLEYRYSTLLVSIKLFDVEPAFRVGSVSISGASTAGKP